MPHLRGTLIVGSVMNEDRPDVFGAWQEAASAMTECYMAMLQTCVDATTSTLATSGVERDVERHTTGQSEPITKADTHAAAKSWYRAPYENPYIAMMDDFMRPWRTYTTRDDLPGLPPTAWMMAPWLTVNSMMSMGMPMAPESGQDAAHAVTNPPYRGDSGFAVANIHFPDERSVTLTLPLPWAMWSGQLH